jgi:hypothetical protein
MWRGKGSGVDFTVIELRWARQSLRQDSESRTAVWNVTPGGGTIDGAFVEISQTLPKGPPESAILWAQRHGRVGLQPVTWSLGPFAEVPVPAVPTRAELS